MKKLFGIFLPILLFVGFFSILPVDVGASNKMDIYLFWGNGCPHCTKEKEFLADILPNYPNVKLNTYEVYYNANNSSLMQKVANKLDINVGGIPLLIIGDKDFVGFAEGATESEIEARLDYCSKNSCSDSVRAVLGVHDSSDKKSETSKDSGESTKKEKIINLPFIGKINALDFSLPALAIIIGAIDGFNPCAMWVLLFLISLLLGIKSRRRMWALGVTFIVASAFVYFLFMAAWLELILFLGFITGVRIAIGLLAAIGGIYHIRSYIKERDFNGCKITGGAKRQAVFEKMKAIAQQNSLWLALGGIVMLAFAVNLVELVCSAGFPAIFTQVLALSDLPAWQYYFYIILYIFFFMLDDIIVFAIAMFTLQATGISTKYSKWSKLIGGIIMLIIGLILVFKPELLMFG